ncbi:hypothetical protein [Sorangium cellulosum]|uniref:hypothetical protein n=1 Tax=Sorangium cellulosum TaxID=56 RepID=UPI0004250A8E|nr:hypothetical protein [Sorangium cellulosum]
MPGRRGLFLVLSLLGPAPLSAGCAQPIDAPDGTAYVLLDPAARARASFSPSASQDALDALAAPAAAAAGSAAGAQEPGSAEAELVGLYAAGPRALLLDASGGFTIEDRCTGAVIATGEYAAAGDRVTLRSRGAAPVVLGRDRERLLHPDWAEFAPLAPEPSRRAEPESESIEDAGAGAGEE